MCNIYTPNDDSPDFFHKVIQIIESMQDKDVLILGGDFNMVMDPAKDRHCSLINHVKSLQVLDEYMNREELCDIWRYRNPESRTYTWCRDGKRPGKISASRIDMFLTNIAYADSVDQCSITPGRLTDHSLVAISMNLQTFVRGPGAWKLNVRLLHDDQYREIIKDTIKETLEDAPHMNPSDRWSLIKVNCMKASRNYSKWLAK